MYGWLWRHLPGRWWLRLVELLVLALGVVALLFYVVFPVVSPHLPINQVTVNQPSDTTVTPAVSPTGSPSGSPTASTTGGSSG